MAASLPNERTAREAIPDIIVLRRSLRKTSRTLFVVCTVGIVSSAREDYKVSKGMDYTQL